MFRSVGPSAAATAMPSTPEGRPWDADLAAEHEDNKASTDADEAVDLKHALMNDPIVGVEQVILDEHGPGGREAVPLRSPSSMTAAQRAKHNLTHQPPDPACPFCAQNRTPNVGHFKSHEHERVIPLLVGD